MIEDSKERFTEPEIAQPKRWDGFKRYTEPPPPEKKLVAFPAQREPSQH